MQAIILAAGMGRRLGDYTRNNTKCMVPVNGVRLIDRLLGQLAKQKLQRVIIVVGYKGKELREYIGNRYEGLVNVEFAENPIYDTTNNIYSLALVKDKLQEDDTLLIESDLIFSERMIPMIVDNPYPNLALVAKYETWMDGTMVRIDDDLNIVNFISKDAFDYNEVDSYYKTVNIYKLSRQFSQQKYVPFLDAYTKAVGNNEYYENVLRIISLLICNKKQYSDISKNTMKNIGIVSCNIHVNFTNYGSALQSWALCRSVENLGYAAKLVDYCPPMMEDRDILNPMKHMWDTDEDSRKNLELSMPAIRVNYHKFDTFFNRRFKKTKKSYTSRDYNDIVKEEGIDGFVCGSDTIFCIDEWNGFEDAYFAEYPCMKNGYAVSYAASFGDAHFDKHTYEVLKKRLNNFKALGIRENKMIPFIQENTTIPAFRTIDPTLLLKADEYKEITAPRMENEKYLLLYARRYNKKMFDYADKLAERNGWKVIDISLRAENAGKHRMAYDAGVEEFLSLVKHSEYVVTNSFHSIIFATQFCRPFVAFSRDYGDSKIAELLNLFGLSDRLLVNGDEAIADTIDFETVHERLEPYRVDSFNFLKQELDGISI